jgi:hypothetical protein
VLFVDRDGHRRQIDFVDAPYGLTARDVVDTAQHVLLADEHGDVPAVIIHPERLMESRIHNIVGLGQRSAHALRQARAAIACAGAFSALILESREMEESKRVRAVLRLNERIYRFCRRPIGRAFVRTTGMDPFDAVLFEHHMLPAKFRTVRYPQMQTSLAQLQR